MRGTFQPYFRDVAANGLLGIGPKTSTALSFGAFLTATFAMGATWLGTSVLGLPIGAWLLGVGVVAAHVFSRSPFARSAAEPGTEEWDTQRDQPPVRYSEPADSVQLRSPIKRPMQLDPSPLSREAFQNAANHLAGASARHISDAKRRLDRLTERLRTTRTHLSVGLDLPRKDFDAVVAACKPTMSHVGGVRVEWVKADPGLLADGPKDAQAFDALLRRAPDGRLVLFTSHQGARLDDPQNDWCADAHIGYPGVFPPRLQSGRTDFGDSQLTDSFDSKLVGALAVVAAILARIPAAGSSVRTTLTGPALLPDASIVLAAGINILGDAMITAKPQPGFSSAPAQAAARVLSAYVTTIGRDLPAGDRVYLAHASLDVLPGDAAMSLRLGAAQLAENQQTDGIATLVRAYRKLRMSGLRCDSDPLAFVLSEAEHGSSERMTLGRICAGLTLAWGTTPNASADYLRDDLIDDLKYAGWLAGREEDVALLREVMTALEREMFAAAGPAPTPIESIKAPTKRAPRKRKAA